MLTVVDMDCTLYSYMELALSQKGGAFSLLKSTLLKDSGKLYDSVDRACKKYSADICKRIQFLIDFLGKERIFIYSSYPLTKIKREIVSSFSIKFHSSFPDRKKADEVRKLFNSKADLVIGDRKEDRELSLELHSSWIGYPYYDFHHLLSGPSYTKAFIFLVKKGYGKVKRENHRRVGL